MEINTFSSHKTSKILALMFAALMLPFTIMGILGFLLALEMKKQDGESVPDFPFLFFAFAPVFYGVMFYLMNRVMLFINNRLAKRVGDNEFETVQVDDEL